MATNSPQQKGRDLPLSTLDITKDACSIPPAQVAFGSVSVLLTTIKVLFFLSYDHGLQIHIYLGHRGQ